jgi:hypothetical protein
MMKKTQFSFFLPNKAGELARLAEILAQAGVNIEGLAISDGIHAGVVKIVVDDPDKARTVLQGAEMPFSEQQVLAVTLPNNPGALAELCAKLAKDGLSIDYVYGSTCGHDEACSCECRLLVSVADLHTAEAAIGLVMSGWPRP